MIVVDCMPSDASTRTSKLLADRTDIRLFAVDDNLGFAGGNEYGVEQATGEYLCFLNPDLVVGPGWLEPLVRRLEKQGLLTSEWRFDDKRKKRYYRLSALGEEVLASLIVEWRVLNDSIDAVLKEKK